MPLVLLSGKHVSGWTGFPNAVFESGNVMSGAQISVLLIYERTGSQCSESLDVEREEASTTTIGFVLVIVR